MSSLVYSPQVGSRSAPVQLLAYIHQMRSAGAQVHCNRLSKGVRFHLIEIKNVTQIRDTKFTANLPVHKEDRIFRVVQGGKVAHIFQRFSYNVVECHFCSM